MIQPISLPSSTCELSGSSLTGSGNMTAVSPRLRYSLILSASVVLIVTVSVSVSSRVSASGRSRSLVVESGADTSTETVKNQDADTADTADQRLCFHYKVQSLYFLNLKVQASGHLLCLTVCTAQFVVDLVGNP